MPAKTPVFIPTTSVPFKRQDLLLAARQIVHHVNAHGRLPHAIRAHGVECGPGELLAGLARAIAAATLPETVTIQPTAGSTLAQPPGYQPTQIQMQGLQQSWSYRPAGCEPDWRRHE